MLAEVLTCHVVATEAMSEAIGTMIADDGGSHMIETVGGCMLNAEMNAAGDGIQITDENGTVANVTIADVDQSNGVIHVTGCGLHPGRSPGCRCGCPGRRRNGDRYHGRRRCDGRGDGRGDGI
jgi:uncharacterized surface protein with fasciclin (FAS1) repeats